MTKRRQTPKRRAAAKSTAGAAPKSGGTAIRKGGSRPVGGGAIHRESVPATEAKNRFGEVLKTARERGPVFIEKHGRHQVVVLDIDTYRTLIEKRRTPDEKRLEELRAEFDELYARMQTDTARAVVDRFLTLSDDELNDAVASRD